MLKRRTVLAVLLAVLALASCKIDTINYFPPHPANVRFANFVFDAPTLDGTANGVVTWPGVAAKSWVSYTQLDNQRTTIGFQLPGASSSLASAQFDLAGEQYYTFMAYGSLESPGLLAMADTTTTPGNGNAQVRIANIAPQTTTVDVYMLSAGQDIANVTPLFPNVVYTTSTVYLPLPGGSYRVSVTPNGTKELLFTSSETAFPAGSSTDLVVFSDGSGRLVNVAALPVNGNAPNTILPGVLARLRTVNTAPQAGTVDALLGQIPVASSVNYPSASSYTVIVPGTRTLSFEATATPGATLASVTNDFKPGKDYSVFLAGFAGSNSANVLVDSNLPTSSVRARFVNASPDAPPLQVLANDAVQASSLAINAATGYNTLTPGTYTLVYKDAASGSTLLSVPGVSLPAGNTITVYTVGPVSSLGILIAVDR